MLHINSLFKTILNMFEMLFWSEIDMLEKVSSWGVSIDRPVAIKTKSESTDVPEMSYSMLL